jgi:PAS domain S-box-containing protein
LHKENQSTSDIDLSIVRALFDKAANAVILIRDREILYANNALEDMLGFKRKQVQGSEVSLLSHILEPESEEAARKQLADLQSGSKQTDHDIYRFIQPSGETAILDVAAHTIEMDGQPLVMACISDITEQELSREKLARERRAYSIIAEAALSTASIKEVSEKVLKGIMDALEFDIGTFRVYNEAEETIDLMAIVGLEHDGTRESVKIDDPDMLVARTARTKQPMFTQDIEESSESGDRLARAKKLGIRSLIFWPVVGGDDKLIGVINVASNMKKDLGEEDKEFFGTLAGMLTTIIERKRTEEQLRESQDRFLAFADNMPGPVFIKDHKSRVLFVNRFMRRQPAPDEWEKMTPDKLFRQGHAETISKEDKMVLAEGPVDRIQNFLDEEGKSRTYKSHKFPIRREGLPPLIGGFSIDITEQVEAENARKEAQSRAEFFNDLMAHDLNNMHQGIMASLELIMSSEGCSDEIRHMAERALQQVGRSVSLINNVKKFSLLNKDEIALEKTDPAGALVAAMEIVKQSFPSREITIETNLTTGTYCIMANEFLQDVFYNLLHNSVKNTETPAVRINVQSSLVQDGEFLRIEVEDFGSGINDRVKESILRGLDDRVHRVSGVGLTLVRQIVDIFSGKVWVEDRVKGDHTQGARFIIHLPNGC